MQALTFNPQDDSFSLKELSIPEPSTEEVRIKVEACGLNPVDAKIRFWKGIVGDDMNTEWVPGLDISGTIDKVGDDVSGWKKGDKVIYHGNMLRPHGGLAAYAINSAKTLLPLPKSIPVVEAAALPCAGWTAWRAVVDKLNVGRKHRLLVIGASGGVGSFAVQIAKKMADCPMVIGVCSTANVEYVKSLGADFVIDYKKEDVLEAVRVLTNGKGVTRSLDAAGGENDILAANALAFEGQMVELVSTVRPERYDSAFLKGLTFHQLSLGAAHNYGKRGRNRLMRTGRAFLKAYEDGQLNIPQMKVINLEEAPAALSNMLENHTVGKIVVKINS